jgi:hypothetical protein
MKIATAFLTSLFAVTMPGCSVYSAASRPDYKDTSIVSPGAPRAELISRLGEPCRTYQRDHARVDIFEVSDAAATSRQKTLRATGYALLDVATLGVGEFWGSETETNLRRQCTTFTVTYHPDDNAQSIETRQWDVEPPLSATARPAGYCGIDYHGPLCDGKQQ